MKDNISARRKEIFLNGSARSQRLNCSISEKIKESISIVAVT